MNVSYKALLEKMELELHKAKDANGQQIHQHMYAIKALAEVILDDDKQETFKQPNPYPKQAFTEPPIPIAKPVTITAEQPIKTDDGANGESLFDF